MRFRPTALFFALIVIVFPADVLFGAQPSDSYYGEAAKIWVLLDELHQEEADERALQATQFLIDGQVVGAVDCFCEAVVGLRSHSFNSSRLAAYRKHLGTVRTELEKAEESDLRTGLLEKSTMVLEASESTQSDTPGFDPTLLKRIKIPKVEFAGTPFKEAIAQIETWSRELDPEGEGFHVKVDDEFDRSSTEKIFLRLSDRSLDEVLRYTSVLAGMRYRLMGGHVRIEAISSHSSELPSTKIPVPPQFLDGQYGTALEMLEEIGIEFRDSSGAVFLPEKGVMFIRAKESDLLRAAEWAAIAEDASAPESALKSANLLVVLATHYRSENIEELAVIRVRQAEITLREIERQNADFHQDGIRKLRSQLERFAETTP